MSLEETPLAQVCHPRALRRFWVFFAETLRSEDVFPSWCNAESERAKSPMRGGDYHADDGHAGLGAPVPVDDILYATVRTGHAVQGDSNSAALVSICLICAAAS